MPVTSVRVDSLPAPYRLLAPIDAAIRGARGDFTATFVAANVGASGASIDEAVDNLKEMLALSFASLEGVGEDGLGPAMRRQQAALAAVMGRA
jgi:predicted RNase H-like HicB family nuclease